MPANVEFERAEYRENVAKWDMIDDCIAGAEKIKSKNIIYLPMPNSDDQSAANKARYKNYLARAIFYNVTRRTLEGLVGQVFAADPAVDVPDELKFMLADASGSGVSADQLAKRLLRYVLGKGRAGVYVDFPVVDGTITRKELLDGTKKPVVINFNAQAIINWRTRMIDGKLKLSLVVLREEHEVDDGFEIKALSQLRVLKLDETDQYVIELWKKNTDGKEGGYTLDATKDVFEPTDSTGKRMSTIPFWFIGSVDNDPSIDEAPMYDLTELNLGHYRNSADYENSAYMVGQPTPWISGLTQAWVDKNFKKGMVQLGSSTVIPLPVGGQCGLLQAEPNSMPKEAMEHKERQMVALGAKLVEQQQVQRTLGEAKMEAATETSVLSSSAKNVSDAMTNALRFAAEFFYGLNVDPEKFWYTLSTDFAISKMSPDERAQLIAEWQAGAISFSEMRDQLRSSGVATLDDEAVKDEIETEGPKLALDPVTDSGTKKEPSKTPAE